MGQQVAALYAEIDAKTEGFEKGLKGIDGKMSGAEGKLKGFGNAFEKVTGVSLSAAGAIAAVSGAIAYSIQQAMEAEQIMAATEATIKATGGAAGLTAEQIGRMAGQLSGVTGIADDVVQEGQNMLLTFKNIKGEAQFDRATKALADMAVAMNGGSLAGLDLKGSAIQLGKALNDPVAGITALTRVGVTFTAEQKEMIKAMVAAGDTAGAQTIILKELESEFGGAAKAAGETTAGAFARLKNNTDNLAESFGKMLLPTLADAAQGLINLTNLGAAASIRFGQLTGRITDEEAAARAAALAAGDLAAGNLYAGNYAAEAAVKVERLKDDSILLATSTTDAQTAIDAWSASMMDSTVSAADLTATIDTAEVSVTDITASFSALTTEMLYNKAAAGLDADEALNLARQMGLVNETTYGALATLEDLKSKYDKNHDGAISASEGAKQYAEEVLRLKGAIDGLQDKTVNIHVVQSGGGAVQVLTGGVSNQLETRRAAGGSFIVPPGYGGDSFPVRAQSGERVDVTPAGQVNTDGGGALAQLLQTLPGTISRAIRDGMQMAAA